MCSSKKSINWDDCRSNTIYVYFNIYQQIYTDCHNSYSDKILKTIVKFIHLMKLFYIPASYSLSLSETSSSASLSDAAALFS